MTDTQPPTAEPLLTPGPILSWEEAHAALAGSRFYWLATTGPDTGPHLRPVLAVWADGSMYSTTAPAARKGRNLTTNPRCSLSARTDTLDIVLEGHASRVADTPTLEKIAAAYATKYGWPVTITDGAFDAPYGAPTAGKPPYLAYEIQPQTVYAFTTDDQRAPRPTRFRFTQ